MVTASEFIKYNDDGTVDVRVMVAFKKAKPDDRFVVKLIKWWTESDLIHSEIIIGNTWVSANDVHGVTLNDLRPLNNKWLYVNLGYITLLPYQYEAIKNFVIDQKGKKYDIMGIIFSQFIPFKIQHDNKWFCSELCVKLLQMLLIRDLNNFTPARYSPADLYLKLMDLDYPEYNV